MLQEKLFPTKATSPCPICEDISGDCRTRDNIVLCHTWVHGVENKLYKYRKPSQDLIWGVYTLRSEPKTFAESLEEQEARHDRLRKIVEATERRWRESLDRQQRDSQIRTLATVGLAQRHREELYRRGLTDAQIEESLYFSVGPGMPVPNGVSEDLPGVKNGVLNTKATGYGCVAFDSRGYAIGFQIRDENPGSTAKYTWAKGNKSSHLQNGELPLSVAGQITDAVLLCEGIQKPRIASYHLGGVRFVGASGGNFAGSQVQMRLALGRCCRRIIICPDAGDVQNENVLQRIQKTISLFGHNYLVQIAWWGQETKDQKDIDELMNWDGVRFLSVKEWQSIT